MKAYLGDPSAEDHADRLKLCQAIESCRNERAGQLTLPASKVSALPDCFDLLPDVTKLDIVDFPNVETPPASIGRMKHLTSLTVAGTSLVEPPAEWQKCRSLTHLAS